MRGHCKKIVRSKANKVYKKRLYKYRTNTIPVGFTEELTVVLSDGGCSETM